MSFRTNPYSIPPNRRYFIGEMSVYYESEIASSACSVKLREPHLSNPLQIEFELLCGASIDLYEAYRPAE
jgi:hypothetical protein